MKLITCIVCGEKREHYAKSKCSTCWQRDYTRKYFQIPANKVKKNRRLREKYHTDPEYREEQMKQKRIDTNKWRLKKIKEEGQEWNAERQRTHRARNPESFNFTMAKWYFKRLTDDQKKLLLKMARNDDYNVFNYKKVDKDFYLKKAK